MLKMTDVLNIKGMLLEGNPTITKMMEAAMKRDDFTSLPAEQRIEYLRAAVTLTELHELKLKIAAQLSLTATHSYLKRIN